MARPDPRLIPILLDQRAAGRESLILGLLRALALLLFGGTSPSLVTDRVNAVARTALVSEAQMTWSNLDRISGNSTRIPRSLIEELEQRTIWAEREIAALMAKAAADIATEIEDKVRDEMANVAADTTQAHGDASEDADDPVIGYRRVPHPELSAGGTCGLCIVASDKIYKRGDLRKIHGGCHCEVVEVTVSYDPGGALNDLELGEVYKAAKLTKGNYGDRSALSHVRAQLQDGQLVIVQRRTAATPDPRPIAVNEANRQQVADLFAGIASAYRAAAS